MQKPLKIERKEEAKEETLQEKKLEKKKRGLPSLAFYGPCEIHRGHIYAQEPSSHFPETLPTSGLEALVNSFLKFEANTELNQFLCKCSGNCYH